MTKEELFKKYNIDESHSKWDLMTDNWMGVEIYRIMNNGELPNSTNGSSKYLLDFLDKVNSDVLFVKSLRERKPDDFGSLYLTAKRSIYLCSELILKELNN